MTCDLMKMSKRHSFSDGIMSPRIATANTSFLCMVIVSAKLPREVGVRKFLNGQVSVLTIDTRGWKGE